MKKRILFATLVYWFGLCLNHLRVVSNNPLPQFGWKAAPFIEHLQRAYAQAFVKDMGLGEKILSLPTQIQALDGQYPPLLHITSVHVQNMVFFLFPDLAVGALAWGTLLCINLIYIVFLTLGATLAAWALTPEANDKSPWLIGGALCLIYLASPGIFATARRYYYDLPMAAMLSLFMGFYLLALTRARPFFYGIGAALSLSLSCLFKWHALIYAFWLFPFGLLIAHQQGEKARWLRRSTAIFALATVLLFLPYSSGASLPESLTRLLEEGGKSVQTTFILGPMLEGVASSLFGIPVALLLCAAAGVSLWDKRARLPFLLKSALWLPPLLILSGRAPVADARFLLPLMVPFAVGVVSSTGRKNLERLFIALCLALPLTWVDVDIHPMGLSHPPLEMRGWSRPSSTTSYDPQDWLLLMKPLCPKSVEAGPIPIDSGLDKSARYAIKWAAFVGCEGADVAISHPPVWGLSSRQIHPGWVEKAAPKHLNKSVFTLSFTGRPLPESIRKKSAVPPGTGTN